MISAPGKLVLLGDYGVLEDGCALVMAVDRRARVVSNAPPRVSLVSDAVIEVAREKGYEVRNAPGVETEEFCLNEKKLGLGSSAAVSVVLAAAVTGLWDERVYEIALEAHRRAARGIGSGVDVAASFYGGVVVAKKQPGELAPTALQPPEGLSLFCFFSGESADTRKMVGGARACPKFLEWCLVFQDLAERGVEAWHFHRAEAFLSVVALYGRAMRGLGRDSGVPIVTPLAEEIMELAEKNGGAAKPSGAGGGDVIIAFAEDDRLGELVEEKTGARWVPLQVSPHGLRMGEAVGDE